MSSTSDLPFKVLADTFESLESITARTQMVNILVALLKKTPPEIIDRVVYIIEERLWPDWKGLPELGIAEKSIIRAIAVATGQSDDVVERTAKTLGDLGKAAESLISAVREKQKRATSLLSFVTTRKELTVSRVYDTFARIAMAQGEGSKDIKIRLLSGLLAEASPKEARYIVRFAEGKLRLGVGEATLMDALAVAFGGGSFARPIIERAYNLRADLGEVARVVATKGIEELKALKPVVGIPIRPMLAERHNNPKEILEKVGGVGYVEYKYDGERAQVHKKGDEVVIFSRRLENITHQYPDVVDYVRRGVKAEEAIVEGEIVAIDPDTGEFKPFQELMHRKRKHDVQSVVKEIPVRVYLFDLLYLNGVDYTIKPLPERRRALEEVVEKNEGLDIAEYITVKNPVELEKFFMEAISDGAEGVMVKAVHKDSVYQAGTRGWLWVKFKRDYRSEMIDTVDLVVVGAFYGRGRRGGKFGALLMAAYNEEKDVFETVCKVGSGFTDEDLNQLPDLLKPHTVDKKPARVVSNIEPDVWVVPKLVAEIIGAELTLSPLHTCAVGKVRADAGISIRFPRFIRWRDDKGPEDATTSNELVEMYKNQLKKIVEKPGEGEAT
ncbi:ATP-dependent DNA ligase [Thermogladius sp. KZ2Tp1]|uniref:ATP-dependent DNA ligase n=1 Tax=Thermogladius sp. KZ2Tp1 TaxID=3136289 RepID=UPI003DAA18F5